MKKIMVIFISLAIMLCAVSCGKAETVSSQTKKPISESKDNNTYISFKNLSIPYEVIDYVENCIIVSKNNGLLYGIVDNEGNEVVPVKYDELEFLNKEAYIRGEVEEIYLVARFEDEKSVLDKNGTIILKNKKDEQCDEHKISFLDYEHTPIFSESTPMFAVRKNTIEAGVRTNCENVFYNKKGEELYKTDAVNFRFFNEKFSLSMKGSENKLLDHTGKVINTLNGTHATDIYSDGKFYVGFLEVSATEESTGTVVILDSNANILETKKFDYLKDYQAYISEIEPNKSKEFYNLYKSNDTYKMEDLKGNPIYLERYYKKCYPAGKHSCVFLTDENDSVCVFGYHGKIYIEAGELFLKNKNVYLKTQNGDKEIDAVHEGMQSIIVVINNSENTEIYFYN